MTASAQMDVVECPECGGEMELRDSWSRKTMPLVGKTVETGEFICTDCGVGRRFDRDGPSDSWS
ncbi:MAG: hypothetical protein ABEJ58_04385 [Halodesulfurarchaeum sp.]